MATNFLKNYGYMPYQNNIPNILFETPRQLGFAPGGSFMPTAQNVDVVDMVAQDNSYYQDPLLAPQSSGGLLGDMFGNASALDKYFTPEQKSQLQNQAIMSAAMQLLASSGPSRTPVGLGQALGEAYGAGQKGYTAAQQNLLTSMAMKQKMEEARAAKNMQANVAGLLSQTAPEGKDPKVWKAEQYMKLADVYAASNPEQAQKFFDMAQKLMPPRDKPIGEPFKAENGNFYQRLESGAVVPFGGGTIRPSSKPVGEPKMQLVNGLPQMVQYYDDGTYKPVSGISQIAKPVGEPKMQLVNGLPQMVQYYDDGTYKPVSGVSQIAKPVGEPKMQLVNGSPQMVQYYDDGTYKPVSGVSQIAKPVGEPKMMMVNGMSQMVQFYDDGTYKPFAGISQKEATPDDIKKLNELGLPLTIENLQKLHPTAVVQEPDQIRTLKALGLEPTLANLQLLKQEPTPAEIRILRETDQPVTIENVKELRRSGVGPTNISVNTGQTGFKNEFDIKKEFTNEPIYKEYQSMNSAFKQIQESLKKANPIGDVAAATKIMKLLDPGSVVRESELGIAMAATGKIDRLTNYVDMWKKGTLLTPTQRTDFNALANELYNASAKAYNDKRSEYAGFGNKYGIDASQALGATAPVFSFTPPPVAGADGRPPLSSIIKPQGVK